MPMNYTFFDVIPELKYEFSHAFETNESDEAKFSFLKKYIAFVENDASSYNRLFLMENPLCNLNVIEFKDVLNCKCRKFLDEKLLLIENSNNKCLIGRAIGLTGAGYQYGLFNFPKDYVKAYHQYLLSSQHNDPFGTYKLATCFEKGLGTDKDVSKALYFYRCAAKLGITEALHVYGIVLANGFLGSTVDQKLGLHYLSTAAKQADNIYPYALFDIGKWYETIRDTLDVPTDEEYSFQIYLKGANLNDPNCQHRLALCFEFGELGRSKDLKKSTYWYKKAAKNGHVNSQLNLVGLYSSGLAGYLKKDLKMAYLWAMKAASKGEAKAALYLGEFSRTGTGVEANLALSLWWYTIAAEMSDNLEAKIKRNEVKKEIEKIDDGPEIPGYCTKMCFYF